MFSRFLPLHDLSSQKAALDVFIQLSGRCGGTSGMAASARVQASRWQHITERMPLPHSGQCLIFGPCVLVLKADAVPRGENNPARLSGDSRSGEDALNVWTPYGACCDVCRVTVR